VAARSACQASRWLARALRSPVLQTAETPGCSTTGEEQALRRNSALVSKTGKEKNEVHEGELRLPRKTSPEENVLRSAKDSDLGQEELHMQLFCEAEEDRKDREKLTKSRSKGKAAGNVLVHSSCLAQIKLFL